MDNKDRFLNRYNPSRDLTVALSKSWGAAVGHNLLYKETCALGASVRKEIHSTWTKLVDQPAFQKMNSEQYENSFLQLQIEMNAKWGEHIYFRLSHAQKGLSVYMKHLWCMRKISEPAQCPVDKVILSEITKNNAYKCLQNKAWTKIDSISEHQEIILAIESIAVTAKKTIAQWELDTFLPS